MLPHTQLHSVPALANNVAVTCLNPLYSLADHLIYDLLRWLLLVNDSSNLTHQEWSGIVESIIVDVITQALHIVFNWNLASAGEILDFLLSVLFPVLDVWVLANAQWATSEDDCPDVVVEAGSLNCFLVCFRCACLVTEDKASANPDGIGSQHEC